MYAFLFESTLGIFVTMVGLGHQPERLSYLASSHTCPGQWVAELPVSKNLSDLKLFYALICERNRLYTYIFIQAIKV